MGCTRTVVILTCVLLVLFSSCSDAWRRKSGRSKRNRLTCRVNSLIRYQMTVKTVWDEDTFPKMFPTYRPPAHWSQLVGRSHGADYRMWQEGTNASFAVQRLAEAGEADRFHLEHSQGYNDVLDAFVAPGIGQSVGETSAVLSVDGPHPKVSFMMKIVPSPDWFIGLDSVSLCYRGRWKRKLQRDLRPFDAGTEQGLTFTSPHWPNDPQEPISAITSKSPDHEASSFFYPQYKVLPKIARVQFEIISEYRLRKVHKEIQIRQTNVSEAVPSIAKQEKVRVDGDNVDPKQRMSSDTKTQSLGVRKIADQPSSSPVGHSIQPLKMKGRHMSKQGARSRPVPAKPSTIQAEEKQSPVPKDTQKKTDCDVSEWTVWSPCSKTCGFGSRSRSREALVLPSNGGGHCPLLKEESICGSMRNCKWKHFSLMGSGRKTSPFGRLPTRKRRIRRRRKHVN